MNILLLAGLSWWFYRYQPRDLAILYWPALVFKLACGIFVGWLYTHYYVSADTFSLFKDSTTLAGVARQNPGRYLELLWSFDGQDYKVLGMIYMEPRSVFFVKILSVFSLLTADNYWITSLYLSWASFLAAFYLVRELSKHIPSVKAAAIVSFLFLPSFVLWSSGIIKESIGITSLCLMSIIIIQWWMNDARLLYQIPLLFLAVLVLWEIRYFYAGLFIPVMASGLIVRKISDWKNLSGPIEVILYFVLLIAGGVIVTQLHPNFYPERFLHVLVKNNQDFIKISDFDDVIHFYKLQPTILSVLINAPLAIFSGLLRPFVWEGNNSWQIIAGLENLAILVMTVWKVSTIRTWSFKFNRLLILSTLTYVILLCLFLALSSPNFGSLARYRVGFLPFYMILVINLPAVRRLYSKLESRLLH